MKNKFIGLAAGLHLSVALTVIPVSAMAVGAGLDFKIEEGVIFPADENTLRANSMDFTYHACEQVNNNMIDNLGYLYISSYQDPDSVVDSQINYIGDQGYHIYAKFNYQAQFVGNQNTPSGLRANYVVNGDNASFTLYLDPDKDTKVAISDDCVISSINIEDDIVLGFSNSVFQGELSETNGLAQGDFKVLYNNWQFTQFAQNPFRLKPNSDYDLLVFNGNITRLRGPLNANHFPEGSGNLFWR